MQIDIGFGDAVCPDAQEMLYPTILNFPAPRLRMYPRETVVAEKLEALPVVAVITERRAFAGTWPAGGPSHTEP